MSETRFVALTRERPSENERWTDYFGVVDDGEPEQKIRDAVAEYLGTPDGQRAIEETCRDFNWGDAILYVPDAIWKKHGITELGDGDRIVIRNPVEIVVNQDEVLFDD